MTTLFISDLHLSTDRPEKLALFKKFLQGPALKADALYILGDLFESFWIGVDDPRPPNQEVIALLSNYSMQPKTRLIIMRGNRDFHIDRRFADETDCELIDDLHLIELDGNSVLLMHGDTLCTDDVEYQRWRKFISNSIIKWLNLHLPLCIRQKIATNVRSYTVEQSKNKSPEITDVNEHTVKNIMEKYKVQLLIHGHTHRQGIHDVKLGDGNGKRIVLGDWYDKDCVLIKDTNGFRFQRIDDYLDATLT